MIQIPSSGHLVEKSHDPFRYLPLELAERILRMLSIYDRLTCISVCKGWKIMLQSLHSLWKILDLSYSRQNVPRAGLQAYLERSNYSLKLAKIKLNRLVDNGSLEFIIENCKCLNELRVWGFDWRGDDVIFSSLSSAKQITLLHVCDQISVSLDVIISILERCQDTLVDVTFGKVTKSVLCTSSWPKLRNLKSLSLGAFDEGFITDDNEENKEVLNDLDDLVQATPNLRIVTLKHLRVKDQDKVCDFRLWKHLQVLELVNNKLKRFPKLPPTLRHLSFSGNYSLSIPESEEKEVTQLPLLGSFSCQTTSIKPRGIFAVIKSCIEANNLKILHIGNPTYDFGNHILPAFLEYPPFSSVEELSLSWMDLDDASILAILMLYPKLRKVILSGNRITNITLQTLAKKESIKSIVIDECYNVDPDEVEDIKVRGIEISHVFAATTIYLGLSD
ncbi:hypothetical protein EPUL_000388 [Erysiphe pulchra]|uniref:F-box domain-containing protein n=1 Tax=Erysiphe pulchra TaxID=225359 RepID=A0A2S4Q154_9PEZI|nr:hypothetical protein EPUL_000388 [Erysiphe pulchra]